MLQTRKKVFGEKIYPWLLVLLPVLSQYPVGPLDMDAVVMILFLLCALVFRRHIRISPTGSNILKLIAYISAITAINMVIGQKFSPVSDMVVRTGRYCMYLLIVFFVGNESVTYESLMKAYRFIAYAATIYVIIQTVVFYGAGITLPSKIGGSASQSTVDVGRLRAFYSEPASLAYSMTPFVACSLFGKPYHTGKRSSSFDAIFVSAGIILSTSSQGIIAIALIWAIWILVQMIRGTFKARQLFLLIGIALVAIILYYTGILEFALGRLEDTGEGGAIDARLSGYESLSLLSPLQLLFGAGFGNYVVANTFNLDVFYEFVNYSSIAEYLFTLGIIGTAFWVLFFVGIFRKGTACTRVLIAAMVCLSLFGCPLTGTQFPLWLTLMCVQLPDGHFRRPVLTETLES